MATPTPLNASHVLFNEVPLNRSALELYNYVLYPNGTVSNNSRCYLVFAPYIPTLLPNGTFLNADKCDSPIKSIKSRGALGITFAVIFILQLAFLFAALAKHGKQYLPQETAYKLVMRRWQYYWGVITVIMGIISCVMAIDIDRFYIQGAPVMLSSIFFYIMGVAALGLIWETCRNWYAYQERLCLSQDQFYFPAEDLRSKIEFYQPLVVYLWIFLCFFLAVLRKWEPIRRQFFWIYEDPKFSASAAFGLIALFTMSATYVYGINNYRINNAPIKIPIMIILGMIHYCYLLAAAVEKEITPIRAGTDPAYIYTLGYTPIVLIVATQLFFAWREENEDLVVKRVRQEKNNLLGIELKADAAEKKRLQREKERERMGLNKGGSSSGGEGARERGVFVNKVDSLDSMGDAETGLMGARRY